MVFNNFICKTEQIWCKISTSQMEMIYNLEFMGIWYLCYSSFTKEIE